MSGINEMNRREALKRSAMLMGAAISAPVAAGILNGCTAKPEINWTPAFFTEDQAILISELAETIIPKTDTPGAKELGVPKFIEDMVATVYKEEAREQFLQGLTEFDEECKERNGSSFIKLDNDEKLVFIQGKNEEIKGKQYTRYSNERPFFHNLKELTVTGYFTTEFAMTNILQYVAIPAEYKGCISVEEAGGRTWAT
jgi:hypothetical protein